MSFHRYCTIALTAGVVFVAGCSSNTAPAASTNKSTTTAAQKPNANTTFNSPSLMASSPSSSSPAQSGGKKPSLEQALAEAPKQDPSLKSLDTAYQAAAMALKANPTSKSLQKAFTDAAYAYGSKIEYGSSLGTVVRYRASLCVYQAALKVNPNDPKCKKEADQIIAIYQEMNEQVPS